MANRIISEQRVKEVMALLLVGTMRCEIVELKTIEWKCTPLNVDKYIRKAKEKFKEHWDDNLKEEILAKHNMLYNQALMSGDRREARENLRDISKLSGHLVDKVEHSGTIDMPAQIIIKKRDE